MPSHVLLPLTRGLWLTVISLVAGSIHFADAEREPWFIGAWAWDRGHRVEWAELNGFVEPMHRFEFTRDGLIEVHRERGGSIGRWVRTSPDLVTTSQDVGGVQLRRTESGDVVVAGEGRNERPIRKTSVPKTWGGGVYALDQAKGLVLTAYGDVLLVNGRYAGVWAFEDGDEPLLLLRLDLGETEREHRVRMTQDGLVDAHGRLWRRSVE